MGGLSPFQSRAVITLPWQDVTTCARTLVNPTRALQKTSTILRSAMRGWTRTKSKCSTSVMLWPAPSKLVRLSDDCHLGRAAPEWAEFSVQMLRLWRTSASERSDQCQGY